MTMSTEHVLQGSNPAIFTQLINSWPSSQWTPSYLAEALQEKLKCKVAPKYSEDQTWETECVYIDATLEEFCGWTAGHIKGDNPLRHVSPEQYSCYVDYKDMPQMFEQCQHLLKAVDWSVFGLEGRCGHDSTIWIGSEGASTPCHYDTYGFNLVAQIHGTKRWHLFPPSSSKCLYPTRLPYEESSVFSQVNVGRPDLDAHPKFKDCEGLVVTLDPGQVLFVPSHWWHYVECLDTAISINTWVEIPDDDASRVSESMTRAAVSCLMSGPTGEAMESWINPNEDVMDMEVNWIYILNSIQAVLNPPESGQNKCDKQSNLCKFAQHFRRRSYETLDAPWSISNISSSPIEGGSGASRCGDDPVAKSNANVMDVNVEINVVENQNDRKHGKRKRSDQELSCSGDSDSLSGECSDAKKTLKSESNIADVPLKGSDRRICILQTGNFEKYYHHVHRKDLLNCIVSKAADSVDKCYTEDSKSNCEGNVKITCDASREDAALAQTKGHPDTKSKISTSPEGVPSQPGGCSSDVFHSGVPVIHASSLSTIRDLFFRSLLSPRVMKIAAEELVSMYQSMNK